MFGIGPFEILTLAVVLVVVLGMGCLGTAFWVWMIVDCATKEQEGSDKVVWIVVIALTHWLGALIYFMVRRRPRLARERAAAAVT